jgi:streptogramin lyase
LPGIVSGPGKKLWFTEYSGNAISSMTTTGAVARRQIPAANSQPNGITPLKGVL